MRTEGLGLLRPARCGETGFGRGRWRAVQWIVYEQCRLLCWRGIASATELEVTGRGSYGEEEAYVPYRARSRQRRTGEGAMVQVWEAIEVLRWERRGGAKERASSGCGVDGLWRP